MEHKLNNLQEELNKLRAEKDENPDSKSPNSEIVNNNNNNKYPTENVNNNNNPKAGMQSIKPTQAHHRNVKRIQKVIKTFHSYKTD